MNHILVDCSIFSEYKKVIKEIFNLFYERQFEEIKKKIYETKNTITSLKNTTIKEKNELYANQLFLLDYYLELLKEFNNFYLNALSLNFEGSWSALQTATKYFPPLVSITYRIIPSPFSYCPTF